MAYASLVVAVLMLATAQPVLDGDDVGDLALPTHVELTNATVAERSRHDREQAIWAGDAEAVFRDGGSPQEIVAALSRLAESNSDPRVSRAMAMLSQLNPGEYYEPAKSGSGEDLLLKVGPDGKPLVMVSMDLRTAHTIAPARP